MLIRNWGIFLTLRYFHFTGITFLLLSHLQHSLPPVIITAGWAGFARLGVDELSKGRQTKILGARSVPKNLNPFLQKWKFGDIIVKKIEKFLVFWRKNGILGGSLKNLPFLQTKSSRSLDDWSFWGFHIYPAERSAPRTMTEQGICRTAWYVGKYGLSSPMKLGTFPGVLPSSIGGVALSHLTTHELP